MKFFLILGGFLGFTLSFLTGLLQANDLSIVVRDACVGCMAGAFLFKLLRMVMVHNVRVMLAERTAAAASAAPADQDKSRPPGRRI